MSCLGISVAFWSKFQTACALSLLLAPITIIWFSVSQPTIKGKWLFQEFSTRLSSITLGAWCKGEDMHSFHTEIVDEWYQIWRHHNMHTLAHTACIQWMDTIHGMAWQAQVIDPDLLYLSDLFKWYYWYCFRLVEAAVPWVCDFAKINANRPIYRTQYAHTLISARHKIYIHKHVHDIVTASVTGCSLD